MTLRVVSYGGGVQSTALLVLAALVKRADAGDGQALRRLSDYGKNSKVDMLQTFDYTTFLFANVGDDSEHPATLEYIQTVAMPFAIENGLEIIELRREFQGKVQTLLERITTTNVIGIPMRLSNGAPGVRICTTEFKIDVIDKWLKPRLQKHRQSRTLVYDDPATVAIGISLDEFQRASNNQTEAWRAKVHPLIDARLTRQDCQNIIADAGISVPPKSSCFFCPFHSITEWQRLKRDEPALFDRSVELERQLNTRRQELGKDAAWLTRKLQPLDQAIGDQSAFDFEDTCESGYCMT